MNPGKKHRALLGRRLLAVFLGFPRGRAGRVERRGAESGLFRPAQLKGSTVKIPRFGKRSHAYLLLLLLLLPTVPTNLATSKSLISEHQVWATT